MFFLLTLGSVSKIVKLFRRKPKSKITLPLLKLGTAPYLFLLTRTAPGESRELSLEKSFHLLDEILPAARTANFRGFDETLSSLLIVNLPEVLPPVCHGFTQEKARENRIRLTRYMTLRTAPGVILRDRHDAAPDGIQLYIAHRRIKVPLIQDAGIKTTLPQVADLLPLTVEILGIEHVDGIESSGQRLLASRDSNKMDVIRHEAVSPYFEAIFGGKSREQLNVPGIVPLFGKHGLPVIAPLRDVVGITNRNGAS